MNKQIVSLILGAFMVSAVSAKDAEPTTTEYTNPGVVTETQPAPAETPEEVLLKAHKTLEEAEKLASAIVAQARVEANSIHQSIALSSDSVTLELLKKEVVAIDARDMSVEELVQAIMPNNWRVLLDVDSKKKNQRLDFIAQKSRDAILQDLCLSLGLQYQYFDQIKDSKGQPSPILVMSAQ